MRRPVRMCKGRRLKEKNPRRGKDSRETEERKWMHIVRESNRGEEKGTGERRRSQRNGEWREERGVTSW